MEPARKPVAPKRRFELQLAPAENVRLAWLMARLARPASYVTREAINRMYEAEKREMLIQAGYQDGKVP